MYENNCPFMSAYNRYGKHLQEYQELELEIQQLTGKDLKCLKALFAQGWTLSPPKKSISSSDALNELFE